LYPVEIRIDENGRPLFGHFYEITAKMSAMREWFDQNNVEPSTCEYAFVPMKIVFRVHFKSEEHAKIFAREFNGRIIEPFSDTNHRPVAVLDNKP
jgi:hypothetical protein